MSGAFIASGIGNPKTAIAAAEYKYSYITQFAITFQDPNLAPRTVRGKTYQHDAANSPLSLDSARTGPAEY